MDTPTPQPTSDAKRDETVLWTKDAILEKAKIDMPDYVSTLTVNHALEFEEHVIVGKSHTKFDLPKTALTDMLLVGFYEGYGMDQRLPVYAFVYEVKRNQVGYTTLKNDANHIRLRFDYMSDINFWKPLCNIGEVLKKFAPVVSALRAFILCQFVLAGYLRNICGYTSFWSELESACKAISDSRPAQSKTPQSSAPRLGKNPATFSAPGKDGSSTAATSRCQETAVSQPQPNSAQSTENSRKRKHDEVENSNSSEIRRRDYSVPLGRQSKTIPAPNPPPPAPPLSPPNSQPPTVTNKDIVEPQEQSHVLEQQTPPGSHETTCPTTFERPQQSHSQHQQDTFQAPQQNKSLHQQTVYAASEMPQLQRQQNTAYSTTFQPLQQGHSYHQQQNNYPAQQSTYTAADVQRLRHQHQLAFQNLLEQNGRLIMQHAQAVANMQEAQHSARIWKEKHAEMQNRIGVLEAELNKSKK